MSNIQSMNTRLGQVRVYGTGVLNRCTEQAYETGARNRRTGKVFRTGVRDRYLEQVHGTGIRNGQRIKTLDQ